MKIKDLPLVSTLGDAFKIPVSDITSDRALAVSLGQIATHAGMISVITHDEYKAIRPKKFQYYYVAKTNEDKAKNKVWRIYLKSQLMGEFNVDGSVSMPKFPMRFPFRFA